MAPACGQAINDAGNNEVDDRSSCPAVMSVWLNGREEFGMKSIVLAIVVCLTVTASVRAEESPSAAPQSNVQTKASQAAMKPPEALARLTEGNGRFVANATKRRDWSVQVAATATGQFPFAAVLGCMDSRTPAEIIFDQG